MTADYELDGREVSHDQIVDACMGVFEEDSLPRVPLCTITNGTVTILQPRSFPIPTHNGWREVTSNG